MKEELLVSYLKSGHAYVLGQLLPGPLEPENGGAGEGRHDLQDAVEVLEELANVGDRRPLLQLLEAFVKVVAGQDLRDDELRHLRKKVKTPV